MQAILLAGGMGTRLQSVVNDRPKPMALIQGKPFMAYLVRQLVRQGVKQIIFAVGYKGSMVEDYFGDGRAFGVQICYSYEETLLGTGGAIRLASRLATAEQVLVLNADTYYQIDYQHLYQLSLAEQFELSFVLREVADISRYGEAVLEGNRLQRFNEKTSTVRRGTINGGVYLLHQDLIQLIPEGRISLEQELIPTWLKDNRALGGFVNKGYFIDIGVPEDYFQFQQDVEKGIVVW